MGIFSTCDAHLGQWGENPTDLPRIMPGQDLLSQICTSCILLVKFKVHDQIWSAGFRRRPNGLKLAVTAPNYTSKKSEKVDQGPKCQEAWNDELSTLRHFCISKPTPGMVVVPQSRDPKNVEG